MTRPNPVRTPDGYARIDTGGGGTLDSVQNVGGAPGESFRDITGDDARVVRSTVRIDSAATAGDLDLGYNGGTGTELQDGAVANDVTNADTYNVLDSVSNAGGGAQTVDAVFSGMTGTASGEVEVEFYVLA